MPDKFKHKDILIAKAKEDFEAANNLIKIPNFSEGIVLFHCQQAIEKALKAYLDYKNVSYPKSHDLEMLLSLCNNIDSSFDKIKHITTLTVFAVESRYDEVIEIPQNETINTVAEIKEALNFILGKVGKVVTPE